jgi:hypothetical protein
MPTLRVSNGLTQTIGGLGKIRHFNSLSEKRVTKCTRDTLRTLCANCIIRVSCSASFSNSSWNGVCWIDDQEFSYSISMN